MKMMGIWVQESALHRSSGTLNPVAPGGHLPLLENSGVLGSGSLVSIWF
jgi:hypothetical protein